MGYVDLHSHVLFGLDDGARDRPMSRGMLNGLAALGFDTVCATPHQRVGYFSPTLPARQEAMALALEDAPSTLTLRLGAENMWDEVFHTRSRDNTVPTLGGGPAFLFELPVNTLPVNLELQIFEFRRKGLLPVMAHPERYQALRDDPPAMQRLAGQCALLVDLGALCGYHGKREMKAARWLVTEGLAHAVASDIHTPDDVRVAAEGMAWIEKKLGGSTLDRLLSLHPREILAGNHPEQ